MESVGVATRKKCSTPVDWAPHKSKKLKGDSWVDKSSFKIFFQLANQLVHVGTRKFSKRLILNQLRWHFILGSNREIN